MSWKAGFLRRSERDHRDDRPRQSRYSVVAAPVLGEPRVHRESEVGPQSQPDQSPISATMLPLHVPTPNGHNHHGRTGGAHNVGTMKCVGIDRGRAILGSIVHSQSAIAPRVSVIRGRTGARPIAGDHESATRVIRTSALFQSSQPVNYHGPLITILAASEQTHRARGGDIGALRPVDPDQCRSVEFDHRRLRTASLASLRPPSLSPRRVSGHHRHPSSIHTGFTPGSLSPSSALADETSARVIGQSSQSSHSSVGLRATHYCIY